ncbi:MAG: site-specific DNA-methyltransferase [Phenylobacterium sp.]|uniref:site-specific DNA-methyltransferase n=1 Tax=Phenylobacterium sp. TaxID=1871053 RepID=UPI0025D56F3D|nr:site-specific DNA-methyltransferase [Phenylobacterium sp.]MCA3737767.1 site-specific DNA-methyltransferase [Phenylobacterium sp.]MCA3755106.1 site-specific DNA-methyltransferase [Phenylobacterium sp.]MCA4916812.1 site-specific DNA-methyltransferase [Phenylobacterium sp.]MCA6330326.1 site-specific DNA-methyltransferase [Phenylobacterium sp.]
MAKTPISIEALKHQDATRLNAPTAEMESLVPADVKSPILAAYERRNPDLDPQLVWRGKDMADWSDLVVEAPPLYIQEKIHPKAIIEDLKRSAARRAEPAPMADLFADFNGLPPEAKTEFYAHEQHWSNRMILGDALKVMASLAEREGLKGKVQCIYIDPPYGIKFNSNFQWSTTSTSVTDGKADHLTREPEQVKAFRDTWRDGIHSYLSYLRDRLTVARDLLTESGSIFVQIGDENVHRVRNLMDEVFGDENFASLISYKTSVGLGATGIDNTANYLVWYYRNKEAAKFRPLLRETVPGEEGASRYKTLRLPDLSEALAPNDPNTVPPGARFFRDQGLTSRTAARTTSYEYVYRGRTYRPNSGGWRTSEVGMERADRSDRLLQTGKTLSYRKYYDDFSAISIDNFWADVSGGVTSRADPKVYVVQTGTKVVERCILMVTDPGDLVLDPTCGSGTTAYVSEQWGRRWITIDTSRVALALARARVMGARYPWYLLADSRDGQLKEAEVTRSVPRDAPTHGRVRQGFVYKRLPHITLKSIAKNAEIDTIWEAWQPTLQAILGTLNVTLGEDWKDWEVPRELPASTGETLAKVSPEELGSVIEGIPTDKQGWVSPNRMKVRDVLAYWWKARIARQKETDASIAAKADTEYLYDQPYEDRGKVRVAGPFTVESLSPHRVPAVDVDDSLFNELEAAEGRREKLGDGGESADFTTMVLDNLKKSGVQQAHKVDRLVFTSLKGWPGKFICAEGQVRQKSADDAADDETAPQRRVAVLVGPEYGTVSRADLVAAAREAAEAGFELLVAAAFNFDAQSSELDQMGSLAVLKARINPDLHMPDLANTGAGNLFTVFGEPDVKVHDEADGNISVEVAGVDMYKAGQIVSSEPDDIAVWFLDTDYNYESFFVRHAYFPGANDPYKALKTTLKAEIDEEAWESLKRVRSRPFPRPAGGTVAVKVINHLGDEVMKVLAV